MQPSVDDLPPGEIDLARIYRVKKGDHFFEELLCPLPVHYIDHIDPAFRLCVTMRKTADLKSHIVEKREMLCAKPRFPWFYNLSMQQNIVIISRTSPMMSISKPEARWIALNTCKYRSTRNWKFYDEVKERLFRWCNFTSIMIDDRNDKPSWDTATKKRVKVLSRHHSFIFSFKLILSFFIYRKQGVFFARSFIAHCKHNELRLPCAVTFANGIQSLATNNNIWISPPVPPASIRSRKNLSMSTNFLRRDYLFLI